MEPNDRVHRERINLGPLANDLSVDLALRWNIDDYVVCDRGGASEAVARQ
jgi:hypothetical protein